MITNPKKFGKKIFNLKKKIFLGGKLTFEQYIFIVNLSAGAGGDAVRAGADKKAWCWCGQQPHKNLVCGNSLILR